MPTIFIDSNRKKTADENFLDAVLIKRLKDMLGIHALTLMKITVTIANINFLQVLDAAADEWGTTTSQERLANISSIGAPWHESEGLASLFRRTKYACMYTVTIQDPITPSVIVDSVLKCIMENKSYSNVYFRFKGMVDQTYPSLMTHFKTAEVHRSS